MVDPLHAEAIHGAVGNAEGEVGIGEGEEFHGEENYELRVTNYE
jgi:hypothetical protein